MRFLVSEKLGPHKYKTPEGYLVCVDAILSRTGTQEYRRCELFGDACDDPDKIITVDRKADEVFSDKTMASFENKAICIEHPNTNVDVENHNALSVGFVRDIHSGEDNDTPVMMGTLVITDKEAVEAVESGEYKELSCGYDCDIEDEHSPQQCNIRGNHVALCKQGRAGIARIVDSKVNDGVTLISERYAKFNLPGYHKGDTGKCSVWYYDLRHVTLNLDGMYQASEKSPLIWIAGKTEYAGKEGRNTGKFKVKYNIWSTFTGVRPYLTSDTVSGVVVTDDANTLKDVSEAFMNNVMKTVNDLISKMRSKGLHDDVTITKSKIWNPDFYLKKEPNYEKARNDIRIMMKNANVEPYDIKISVYDSYIKFNPGDVKFDARQLKQILTQVLQQINRSLSVSSIRSRGGTVTFEIAGYQYLQEKYKVFDATKDTYTDFEYGYRDGKLGTYDKWYRYNRKDEGKEYDLGIQKAKSEGYEIKTFIKGTGDSMKDKPLIDMDIHELMKYYTGKNTKSGSDIFLINGKYAINPNISSKRYNTIAELEAAEVKQHAYMRKGYAKNDPNQFGDSIEDDTGKWYRVAYYTIIGYSTNNYELYVRARDYTDAKTKAVKAAKSINRDSKICGKNFMHVTEVSEQEAKRQDPSIVFDSTTVKDESFENAMKRWGFIGSLDDNYKKGTTYIDLDNNGVYDKARLIGYFTNMTDLTQMLKRIGVIHDSMQDNIVKDAESKWTKPILEVMQYRKTHDPERIWNELHYFTPFHVYPEDKDEAIREIKRVAKRVQGGMGPMFNDGKKLSDSELFDFADSTAEDSITEDAALRDEISYYGNSWDRLVKKIVPKDKIISIGTNLGRGRTAIVEGKEYADALKKATLSEGKVHVYTKPYGSYPNYFEVSFSDSTNAAQTQDTFTVEYVKDNITHIVEVEAKTITDAVIKAKTLFK